MKNSPHLSNFATQGLDSNLKFTLPDIYREDIKNIAIQHTLVGGEAVHIARAMLDTVIEFDGDIYEVLRSQPSIVSDLLVYPVPVRDMLTIEHLPITQGTLQIFDVFGRLVQAHAIPAVQEKYTIQVVQLEAGIYTLVVLNTSGNQVDRVIFSKQ